MTLVTESLEPCRWYVRVTNPGSASSYVPGHGDSETSYVMSLGFFYFEIMPQSFRSFRQRLTISLDDDLEALRGTKGHKRERSPPTDGY